MPADMRWQVRNAEQLELLQFRLSLRFGLETIRRSHQKTKDCSDADCINQRISRSKVPA
jgi:hypothetical protein